MKKQVKQASLSTCQSSEDIICPWPTGLEGNIQMLQVMEMFIPHMEDAVGEHLRPQIISRLHDDTRILR